MTTEIVVDLQTHNWEVFREDFQLIVETAMPSVIVGVPGPQGPPGSGEGEVIEGPQGIPGPQGPAGSAGPQGVQGIQGSPGYGVDILGEKATVGALPPIAGASPGDAWIVTADGDLYVAPQNLSAWVDAGQIVGPQGVQGIQGSPGAQGIPGNQGIQGVPGSPGTNGVVAATISLPAATGQITSITIADDGSSTGSWPNRWEWKYDPNGAPTAFLVNWQNEYGEQRHTPAKSTTVAWRTHARNNSGDTPHVGYVADIELARDVGTVLWGVDEAGMYAAGNFRRPNNEGTQTQPVQRVLTQAAYDGITTKDPNCLYFIVG